MEKVTQRTITQFCLLLGLFLSSAHAAVLKSETAAAFDHYVRVTIDMQASDLLFWRR